MMSFQSIVGGLGHSTSHVPRISVESVSLADNAICRTTSSQDLDGAGFNDVPKTVIVWINIITANNNCNQNPRVNWAPRNRCHQCASIFPAKMKKGTMIGTIRRSALSWWNSQAKNVRTIKTSKNLILLSCLNWNAQNNDPRKNNRSQAEPEER